MNNNIIRDGIGTEHKDQNRVSTEGLAAIESKEIRRVKDTDALFENRIGRCTQKGLDPFLSVVDAAEYLGVSSRFVYERISTSEIDSQPLGRLRRIRLSTLEKWLIREKG